MSNLTTKRFVIRKSLIGKNTVITFVNKKQETVSYNHDEVYNTHKERFESMNCFQKYKSYTNSNCVPSFCRNLQTVTEQYQLKPSQFHLFTRKSNMNKYTVVMVFVSSILTLQQIQTKYDQYWIIIM